MEFFEKYKLNLTVQQIEAATTIDGPVLLLAVPGSGKTTTLVARLGYMLYEKNIKPENILVLTYTVAATKDMSERFIKIFGDEFKENLEFRTINGICAKIILYFSRKIGKVAFSLESDERVRAARISSLYQRLFDEYPTEGEVRDISTAFTYIKNMMLTKEEIVRKYSDQEYDIPSLYDAYCSEMKSEGLMDYDDQMRYAYNILQSDKDTLSYFQDIYKYICVDEAQDTSKIQHKIIALLACRNDNLFMVGDEDQCIYSSFRAAYPEALLNFDKEHKNARVLVMEENFRSNSRIVTAADRFIQKNVYRHKKNMVAHRDAGEEIKVKELPSRAAQYEYLLKKLENTNVETAVLYRNNDSVIPLVDRLDRNDIAFRIKNAELIFFTNRVVTDILDIIRFSLAPYDDKLFMKIYYKMNLYLTKQVAMSICEHSKRKDISILTACQRMKFDNPYKADRLKCFVKDMELVAKSSPSFAVYYISEKSGYKDYLEKNHIGDGKAFILREIARPCSDYKDFFSRFDYLRNLISENDFTNNANIILSTIHSSKGLEYDTVYMLDVYDGVLPEKTRTPNMKKDELMLYEEERRIYYVGITRAKNKLVLLDISEESSFIDDTVRVYEPAPKKKGIVKKKGFDDCSLSKLSYTDFCNQFYEGLDIEHSSFGKGTVNKLDIPFISIDFSGKERRFSLYILYKNNYIRIAD